MASFFKPLLFLVLVPCLSLPAWADGDEKLYVAVEGESALAVFDTSTRQISRRIDLSAEIHGLRVPVAPHNVQAAPDGSSVWVTANSARHGDGQGHGETGHPPAEPAADEVIVIDPATDVVTHRIPLAPGLHLAHIVVMPDGSRAFATAQNESALYEIDARTFRVARKIQAPPGSQPHGLRLSPDGAHAYIALLQANSLGILDTATGQLRLVALSGAPVQTAVTPDGRFVLVSLYDAQRIAVYETASQSLRYIDLLGATQGPVQLYPTPDSRAVYVADQGHYFGRPDGEWIYKVDLQRFRTVWSIRAGRAPHGIVIDKEGRHAYVTNLVSNDISVIDLKKDQEVARLPVGAEPNGISLWNQRTGGTP